MPELPEVEVVRRALAPQLIRRHVIDCEVHSPRLRWPIDPLLPTYLVGRQVLAVERRSKYLLVGFDNGTLLLHFGMAGKLRWAAPCAAREPHDHLSFVIDQPEGSLRLYLNDPRRFGAALWHPLAHGPLEQHPRLSGLAIEPFDARFDGAHLFRDSRRRSVSVKSFLLSAQSVVGVGNIYASESLFRAGIHPERLAGSISRARYDRLALAIRTVLSRAIEVGGSSLRDYAAPGGELGAFQAETRVYGREGQPCWICGRPIVRLVQGQRSTFYCPKCQS